MAKAKQSPKKKAQKKSKKKARKKSRKGASSKRSGGRTIERLDPCERLIRMLQCGELVIQYRETRSDIPPSGPSHTDVRNESDKFVKRLHVRVRREPGGPLEPLNSYQAYIPPQGTFLLAPGIHCPPPVHEVQLVAEMVDAAPPDPEKTYGHDPVEEPVDFHEVTVSGNFKGFAIRGDPIP